MHSLGGIFHLIPPGDAPIQRRTTILGLGP